MPGGRGCDTIEGYAEVVVAFLHAVGIERAIIVGHSMGGAIAQTVALDFADPSTLPMVAGQARVAGLVLVATGARLRVAPAILEGIRSDFEQTVELITRFAWSPEAPRSGGRAAAWAATRRRGPYRTSPPALVEQGRKALLETDPDVVWGDFAACDRFDVMERLGEIHVPTLIVVGSADQLTPVKYARFLAERIFEARCAIVEASSRRGRRHYGGASHMVMLERPCEVVKVVREFLMGIS